MKTYFENIAKSLVLLALLTAPLPAFSQASGSGKPAPDMEYACMESNIETLLNGAVTPWHPPADGDQD